MSDSKRQLNTKEQQIDNNPLGTITGAKETKFAHMGYRCAYTLIAWIVLAKGIALGPGFFTSLVLFLIPLLFDYLKFAPYSKLRIRIKAVEIGITVILIIIGAIGLCGDVVVAQQQGALMLKISDDYLILKGATLFPLYILWGSLSISVILTFVDYFLYREPADEKYLEYHLAMKQSLKG